MVSYRVETLGALAIVTLLNRLSKHFNVQDGYVQIHVDNMETVNTVKKKKRMLNTANSIEDNMDVAIELCYQIDVSPFNIQGRHVKAHMDDSTDDLSPVQELNKRMDSNAGQFIRNPPPRFYPHNVPYNCWHNKLY